MMKKKGHTGIVKEFFDRGALAAMPKEDQKTFLRLIIRGVLHQSKGLSLQQISTATSNTPIDLLEPQVDVLEAAHEIGSRKEAGVKVYFEYVPMEKSGKSTTLNTGDQKIGLMQVGTESNPMVLIQEIKTNFDGNEEIVGGALIPLKKLDELIAALSEMKPRKK